MKTAETAVCLALLFLALAPAPAHCETPYSDAAFSTFISVSTNGTEVTARVTFLNITYFREYNESALGQITVPGDLHKKGNYSIDNFTASIDPLNGSSLNFTFEGMEALEGGAPCDHVATDERGIASCKITHYKSASGEAHPIDDYKSCGYVTITSGEMTRGSASFPSAVQTAVICPGSNAALSAFGPAIYSAVSNPARLPYCLPAMLIAGLLIAAMYYSGRDPLSLFDLTTPKLPKTQTFKVRMGQAPQMLRQVTRRYIMIKNQARRDALREITRIARKGGNDVGEARKKVNGFYDYVEAKLKKGGISKTDEHEIKSRWAGIMRGYRFEGKSRQSAEADDFNRSINITSGLLMAYLHSHAAMRAMAEARSKGKGSIVSQQVTKILGKATNASVAFETSGTGRFLGSIPFVRGAIATPGKVLDVMAQFRGSRAASKGVRNEMVGQAAYMLGHKKSGEARGIYRAFERLNVRKDAEGKMAKTGFGKIHNWLTGRNWENFEKKHDLSKKALVTYWGVDGTVTQLLVDAHNDTYRELGGKLLFAAPIRANAARELAEMLKSNKAVDKALLDKLAERNSLFVLFKEIRKSAGEKGKKESDKIVSDLITIMRMDVTTEKGWQECKNILARVQQNIEGAKTMAKGSRDLLEQARVQLKTGAECDRAVHAVLHGGGDQADKLRALYEIAGKSKYRLGDGLVNVNEFRDAEKDLKDKLIVYLGKDNLYRIVDKEMLKNDMSSLKSGISNEKAVEWFEKKYGEGISKLLESPETYKQMMDVRAASTGKQLREAIDLLAKALSAADRAGRYSFGAADRAELDAIRSKYGAKGDRALTAKEMLAIVGKLDGMKSLEAAEKNIFKKFDEKSAAATQMIATGGERALFERYENIAKAMNDRLAGADLRTLAREGNSYGKNPLELAITEALKKMGVEPQHLYRMDENGRPVAVFRSMDILDQYFGKVTGDKEQAFLQSLKDKFGDRAAAANMNTNEYVFKSLTKILFNYSVDWTGKNFAATEILHNGKNAAAYMANFTSATRDVYTSGKFKSNSEYLRGEKPMYRQEMGYAGYKDRQVESQLFNVRLWEKVFGYTVSHKWDGTSRGEQVLGLYDAARKEQVAAIGMYKKLFENLVNKESKFYDKNFIDALTDKKSKYYDANIADAIKNGATAFPAKDYFNANAYNAVIERGYRWQDKKNGLELLMSVDRKSLPMLEYEQKYMHWQNGKGEKDRDGIVRKGDVVDYAPLLARTMGSHYASREVGFVILENKGTDGKDKWVYTDPFKNKRAQNDYQAAERQLSMRGEIAEKLAGVVGGNYDPKNSPIRVISIKDFMEQSRKNPDVFGNYNAVDRMREGARALGYKFTMASAEFNYGAFSDRLDKMSSWYSAQWQLRQTLNRFAAGTMSSEVMAGKERWKYDQKTVDNVADEILKEKIGKEMRRLEQGEEAGIADGARAWYHNWHGRIASNIAKEIGEAENNFHNLKLELRALDRLQERNEVGGDYEAIRRDLMAKKNKMEEGYAAAKKEYGDYSKMLISWTSSHDQIYNPQRTLFNMGIAGALLDSKFRMGTNDAFYQITESSVMRDPRVAIGAGPGMDYSWYVGYHTGQNVYERARFWATNSLWEQQMHMGLNITYAVHKWWNDKTSFLARYTAGYPAPVKSDMMYAPTYEHRNVGDYFKALLILPFQGKVYSDYFKARLQDTVTFSGAGHALAAYQSTGGYGRGEDGRSWARRQLDKLGMESGHNFNTPFRIYGQQRYIEQIHEFDNFIDKQAEKESKREKRIMVDVGGEQLELGEARRRLDEALVNMTSLDEDKYKDAVSDEKRYRDALFEAIGKSVTLRDRRGVHIRNVFAGSDIQEDGSRNRFLDMYIMFHSNVFTPTIPGMMQASPITGDNEWHSFPQVARQVENARERSWLGTTKSYWEASYDKENDVIRFSDRFSTRLDSVAEAYKNDTPLLMHLMKMQSKEIGYAPLGTPSLYFINPILVPAGKYLYRTAVHTIPSLSSLSTTADETWLSRAITGAEKEKGGKAPGYGYPDKLYKSSVVADRCIKASEYLKETVPGWSWVHRKVKKSRHATSPGRKALSDETMAESFEMLLATGLYSDDYE